MNTRTRRFRYLLFVSIFPFFLTSQTVDEVLAKHMEAHGGQDAWNKVDAIKISGTFTAFSLENDYSCYKTKVGSYYADLYLGEEHVIEAIHGEEAWTIDPWQEIDYARKLNASEMNALEQKAVLITPFLDYQEKGHSVDYSGLDTVDGMIMHVLTLTRSNGKTERWYLNANTYLEYKCESEWVDFARMTPAETYFDDFQSVEGLVFPFFVERTFLQRDRILLVENLEINPKVDPAMFKMPRRPEMDDLSFLEGMWDVDLEAWTRRGTWYPMGNCTSTITFVSQNLLQEQITYERIFSVSKKREFAYNDNLGKYQVSEYNDLTTGFSIHIGELTDTSFVFDDTTIEYKDLENGIPEHSRYIINSIEPDGFTLERLISNDGGENWSPRDRFTYSRKDDK